MVLYLKKSTILSLYWHLVVLPVTQLVIIFYIVIHIVYNLGGTTVKNFDGNCLSSIRNSIYVDVIIIEDVSIEHMIGGANSVL